MTLRIYGKRTLKSPSGSRTRPTSSRMRQTLFDVLGAKVEGCRWLDLCSGAGTTGAEALARGAALVVGVELSRGASEIARRNWSAVARPGQGFRVIAADVVRALRRMPPEERYDVVFFDPPYGAGLYDAVLPLLEPLVAPDGVAIVEAARGTVLAERLGSLTRTSLRRSGRTELSFYAHAPEPGGGG